MMYNANASLERGRIKATGKPKSTERRRSSVINRRISIASDVEKPRLSPRCGASPENLHEQIMLLGIHLKKMLKQGSLLNSTMAFNACLLAELAFRGLCKLERRSDNLEKDRPDMCKIVVECNMFTGDKILDNALTELKAAKKSVREWLQEASGK